MTKKNTDKVSRDKFLPVSRADMEARGWEELDFLLISGDAYVDHPSFGHAIISRCIEAAGFRVGIIAQPDWRSTEAFARLGRPRFGVFVTAGNLDSMLNHYTASLKKRHNDSYSPGGKAGLRPDRATIVYCNRIREIWKDIPLVIGGIEASLRRFAHYDYWSGSVRRSLLADSRADLLSFGMGELSTVAIARALSEGRAVSSIRNIPGTCWKTHEPANAKDAVTLPSFEEVSAGGRIFAEAFAKQYAEQNPYSGKRLIQNQGAWHVVQNRPSRPLTTAEMDKVYALPYTRCWHPDYDALGGVPALAEVKFSITSHRGCFGECAFCAIAGHQGRIIQRRSDESIIKEAEAFKKMPDFKGYIHDVGGPTANFMQPACAKQEKSGACSGKSCLFPKPCPSLRADHSTYISLLRKLRALDGIKKVFIRSGVRCDYLLEDKENDFLSELCEHHVSGQLKIAPEHASPKVLELMRKPPKETTLDFMKKYAETNKKLGLKQYLVPYFISAHPGAALDDAVMLAEFIRDTRLRPEQVQDFTPTPGSASTCMYFSGFDPFSGKEIYVAKSTEERKIQRALMQYWLPENEELVRAALIKAGRPDLIGNGEKCLVKDGAQRKISKNTQGNRRQKIDKNR